MQHGWTFLRPEDRRAILDGVRDGTVYGGPFHAELDPVDVCNSDCFFCNSRAFREGDILRWDRLEPIVDELIAGGLRSYRLAGGGEPLLYSGLAPLCEKMRAAGVALDNLTTNGVLLDDEKIALLAPLGPTQFMVSLNYVSPERYRAFMRKPSDGFERVIEAIRRLDRALIEARRRETSKIHIQFFVHHATVPDVPRMVELARDLPVDTVTLRSVGGLEGVECLTPDDRRALSEWLPPSIARAIGVVWIMFDLRHEPGLQEEADAHLAEAVRRARGPDAPPKIADDAGAGRPIEFCYIGWYSLTLRGNGDAHPCCFLMPLRRTPPVGNAVQTPLRDIWRGPAFETFRREMRRAMILETRAPLQARRARFSLPMCWNHRECPLAWLMADPDFYWEAHEMLESLRRRPGNRLARLAAGTGRRILDRLRRNRQGGRV